jgi:hypothetical protein
MVLAMAPLPTPTGLADGLALKDCASTPKRGFTPVATGSHRRLHGSPVPADPAKGTGGLGDLVWPGRLAAIRAWQKRVDADHITVRELSLYDSNDRLRAPCPPSLGCGDVIRTYPPGSFYAVPETRFGFLCRFSVGGYRWAATGRVSQRFALPRFGPQPTEPRPSFLARLGLLS